MCEIHLLPLWVTVFLLIYSHLTVAVEENVLDHSYMYKKLVIVQFNKNVITLLLYVVLHA